MSTFIQIQSGGGSSITVVANYAALPTASTVFGQFYWCRNSQGTSWLPGPLGGTYYPKGMYYSNGTTWEFIDVPYQATQVEVDAGTVTDKFVTPKTFNDSSQLASKVPNTRTINGLDLTVDRTLTTNDIADSSNKRYVTNAQQTILNKTLLNDKIISGSSINVTTESILGTFTINANTLSADDVIKIMASTIKVGTAGVHALRIRHNTSNTLVGATQIAIVNVTNTASINVTFSRQNLVVTGGNLTASFPFTNSALTDINNQSTTAPSSAAFDVTVTNYFFITVVLFSASDSISLRFATIQNF